MNKFIKIVKRNIRRTPYQALAASMVMFLTFLTLLVFMVLSIGSARILQYYESKPQAIAIFKDNTTQTDVKAIQDALMQTGKVTTTRYVSHEEALQIYKDRNKNDPKLLELVTANILPTSLEVSTTSPQDLTLIAQMLRKEPVVDDIIVPEDVIQVLTKTTAVIRSVGSIVVGFLILFSILLLLMVIGFKIRIKRTEIEIMKLLGASSWFIRIPFILEGITYGVIGAFAAWVITYAVIWYFSPFLQFYLQGIPSTVISFPINPLLMLGLLFVALLIAVIIGALGSYGAVRRYLKI